MYLESNDPFAIKLARAAFPSYKGKRFKVEKRSIDQPFHFYGSYWDSGCRHYWAIVKLDNRLQAVHLPDMHPYFNKEVCEKHERQTIPKGYAIVGIYYSGDYKSITFYLHPDDFVPLLKDSPDLTIQEKIVLCLTRSYKSSFRQQEREYIGLPKTAWDDASQTLKEKGFLNKAGAITTKGRNAIGDTRDYELKKEYNAV